MCHHCTDDRFTPADYVTTNPQAAADYQYARAMQADDLGPTAAELAELRDEMQREVSWR